MRGKKKKEKLECKRRMSFTKQDSKSSMTRHDLI